MEKYTIGIFLFDNVEVLDFAGPFEVFSVAAELSGLNFFDVFTISSQGQAIVARNGLRVTPTYSFISHPPISLLLVPGGEGSRRAVTNRHVTDWIEEVHENSFITASVCTGARLLARTGLLKNLPATTHHQVINEMVQQFPEVDWQRDRRFIDNGKTITCGGVSAGIDMSLYLVEKLFGRSLADRTRQYMEYGEWKR